MATTLTLKNIPDEIYARLRSQAARNRRSLNSEAIVCLDAVLNPDTVAAEERLARIRALRASFGSPAFGATEIDTLKREGRE